MSKKTDTSKPAPLVVTRDLHKTYRLGKVSLEVLRGVDLTVRAGEFTAIYGHSGSGKSTLLHLVGLLDTASEGQVILDGQDTTAMRRRRNRIRCREIGFIFQFYHLLPELTVMENTLLPMMVDTSSWRWVQRRTTGRKRAGELLGELGLGDRLGHRPAELSGGERQRVAIARALINQPRLLLADEPTGNLDTQTGRQIMDVLLRFNREHGQTILMVTHDEDLAEQVGRSLYLQDGQLASRQR
jgi:lipoprotein-releasing system ATP-binding protein